MEIIIEGHKIDTKNIFDIVDAGFRKHGFIIKMIDGTNLEIYCTQEYEMSNIQLQQINKRYKLLEDKIRKLWESDKTDIPILKL